MTNINKELRPRMPRRSPSTASTTRPSVSSCNTANIRTKILDVGGFDSSIILISSGGIPRPTGDFLESLSQAILVGRFGVGGHTCDHLLQSIRVTVWHGIVRCHVMPENNVTREQCDATLIPESCSVYTRRYLDLVQVMRVWVYRGIYICIFIYIYI